MEMNAVFKISYGLFFISTEYKGQKAACVVNTVTQVTQTPILISVTVLKSNFTHDMIKKSNKFFLGIMGQKVDLNLIDNFGSKSGRNFDKFQNAQYEKDILENPIIEDGCIATLSCKVVQTVDLPTHTTFIAELVDAKNISKEEPITYADYRNKKVKLKGGEKMAETATYECTICHYVYDGDIPFEELPDDYVCPVCGEPKSAFEKV